MLKGLYKKGEHHNFLSFWIGPVGNKIWWQNRSEGWFGPKNPKNCQNLLFSQPFCHFSLLLGKMRPFVYNAALMRTISSIWFACWPSLQLRPFLKALNIHLITRTAYHHHMIFSLETSTTPRPTTWTQPTATRRTTPKKLQPVSKRSPSKRRVSLWKKTDANLSCRQLTFTRTWGGSLLQQNIMRQLQESLSPRWTFEPIWINFFLVFRCFSILNPDLNQLFQCADLDKAMQHYEQVAEKFRNPSSNQDTFGFNASEWNIILSFNTRQRTISRGKSPTVPPTSACSRFFMCFCS